MQISNQKTSFVYIVFSAQICFSCKIVDEIRKHIILSSSLD